MNYERALTLIDQLIEMAEDQQEELYKLYHSVHQSKKTVGDMSLLFHLKILKNIIEDGRGPQPASVPTIHIENPSMEFGGVCCGGGCHEYGNSGAS